MLKNRGFAGYLKSLVAPELAEELRTLHGRFPLVREYYDAKLSGDQDGKLLGKYKKIIQDEFLPSPGRPGRGRLSVARAAVNVFSKIAHDPQNIAEIMVFYVEIGVAFTNRFGDIDGPFYASMELMYAKAALFVEKHGLKERFVDRFVKMVNDTSDMGWGFGDALREIYFKHFSDPVRG